VRGRDYPKAYGFLSPAVRREIPYRDFAVRADDIKRFDVLRLDVYERAKALVRYKVKGKVKLVYKGQLFLALYAGTATVTRHGDRWTVEEVELKPISQKRLGKAFKV